MQKTIWLLKITWLQNQVKDTQNKLQITKEKNENQDKWDKYINYMGYRKEDINQFDTWKCRFQYDFILFCPFFAPIFSHIHLSFFFFK